jgi:hypothetical protein
MTSNSKTGLKRMAGDEFYTNETTVKLCIENILNIVDLNNFDLIIEPSAGTGVFIDEMKKHTEVNILGYDINPKNDNIIKQDYLELNINDMKNKNILVIGNPPFGKMSSYAKKFIKKSCMYAKYIAFILPRSFKKESMYSTFNIYYHNIFEIDIPPNSFIISGKIHDVPCVFQIWQKKDTKRDIPTKYKPVDNLYSFVKKENNPSISIRRVGVYAGTISQDISNKSHQSHYFIKVDDKININNFIDKFNKISFQTNNTVGPKSISKNEFIEEINKIINT